MRNLTKTLTTTTIIAVIVLTYACNKEKTTTADKPATPKVSLTGKWKLTETFLDPGNGSGTWQPVGNKGDYSYIQFNQNGKLESNFYTGYETYGLKDSTILIFTKSDSSKQNYKYTITGSTLSMSPAGPMICFEGCGQRFIKL